MGIKLSNKRILNGVDVLSALTNKQLPVKVSYAIAKNVAKIEAELKTYNSEREKLLEKYSKKDEEGKSITENGNVTIQEDKVQEWDKDIADLLAIENEIDIHKFSINEFNNRDYDISPAELMTIDYMITE